MSLYVPKAYGYAYEHTYFSLSTYNEIMSKFLKITKRDIVLERDKKLFLSKPYAASSCKQFIKLLLVLINILTNFHIFSISRF